jgi:hypothetical protein
MSAGHRAGPDEEPGRVPPLRDSCPCMIQHTDGAGRRSSSRPAAAIEDRRSRSASSRLEAGIYDSRIRSSSLLKFELLRPSRASPTSRGAAFTAGPSSSLPPATSPRGLGSARQHRAHNEHCKAISVEHRCAGAHMPAMFGGRSPSQVALRCHSTRRRAIKLKRRIEVIALQFRRG